MASSNFLTWDSPGVNIENDAQYAADSLRSNGAPTGAILPSPVFNKFALQTSIFAAAFCEMLANNGFSTSDSNQAALAAVLDNIQLSTDVKALQATVPFSPNPVFDCSLASSFRIGLNGNVTSSTLVNVPPAGGIITFFIVSNPGVFSFAWPVNVQDGRNVQTESLGQLFVQQFISDGTDLWPIDTFEQIAYQAFLTFSAAQSVENGVLTNLGNSALAAANAAQGTANTAIGNAATAQGTANTALTNANNAQGSANAAQGSANTALSEIAALQLVFTRNDVTGSRSFNTSFTNPYGKPMMVTGYGNVRGNDVGSVQCFVNGDGDFATTVTATVDNSACGFSFHVPTGGTYQINANTLANNQGSAVTSVGKWIETVISI